MCSLHGFADARIAYGANMYVQVTTSDGHYSHLLASKTQVAPLKAETIPRLELIACLTLALLITAVYKALACTIEVDAVIKIKLQRQSTVISMRLGVEVLGRAVPCVSCTSGVLPELS